ncbi:hypothetical protein [Rudanella lutea]|jgi:hypothetical protein|uniref:hypothetical protein n=1 Tax=Rudanella lutea TaxID=451374 RepID=UPI000362E069|nr:hypothetical protein [Rudanella lutea]
MAKSFLNGLFSLILGQAEDKARSVSEEYLTTGRQGRSTTLKIRHSVETILEKHRYAKIGKTVQPAKRFQATDYREYQTMYLVYKTSSDAFICHYESYFIKAFAQRLDNKHENSTGRLAQINGMNYLYVVVAD